MPAPVIIFSACIMGMALAVAVGCMLLWRARRGQPWLAWMSALAFGHALLSLANLLRNGCTDVVVGDAAMRLNSSSACLIAIAWLGLVRSFCARTATRLDMVLTALLGVALSYAMLSPGGYTFDHIASVGTKDLGWAGTVSVLNGPPDALAAVVRGLLLVGIGRITWMALTARHRLDRISVGMHLFCVLTAVFPIIHSLGLSQGWWGGIPTGEYALSTLFIMLCVETYRQERAREAREREHHAQLEAVLGHGLGFAGLLQPDGRLILANQVSLRAINADPADVLGRPFDQTPWWTHSAEAQARLRKAIATSAGGKADRFITTHRLPDGRDLDIDFSLLPFRDPAGHVTHLIAEGRDISELRRYERMMREGSRLEAIGQLAGGIAHDFNNVLGGIMGAAELAMMRTKDAETRRWLATILSATEKAGGLTKRLLSYARKAKTSDVVLHINATVHDTLELFSRVAGPGITIERTLDADPDCVVGDPSELQSAILNLCINARDAMPNGGQLRISTTYTLVGPELSDCESQPVAAGAYVRIDVGDNGTGIPNDVLPRIFDPFFTTKPEGQGTGLGLPAVLGTVRVHNGALLLATGVGRGTTFSILLPAAGSSPAAPLPTAHSAARGSGLVVIVDDDAAICGQAAELLRTLGFQVEAFTDPIAARERLRSPSDIRCLIVDLAMPGLNGLDLYRLVRSSARELPVIISSGFAGGGQVSECDSDPRLRFLPKPWRLEQLRLCLVSMGVLSRA